MSTPTASITRRCFLKGAAVAAGAALVAPWIVPAAALGAEGKRSHPAGGSPSP